MEAASPEIENQGFLTVVFHIREYSGQPDRTAAIAEVRACPNKTK